jgi:hypothetical protein
MTFRKSILLLISVSTIAALVACSSSSTTPPPPPAISVSLPTPLTSLAVNATASISATVVNDSANAGVTWSVTCGSAGACGSFNPTATASGVATVYTAPAAVPTGNTVNITATSVTDATKTASALVTIEPAPAIVVTFTTTFSSIVVDEFIGIQATVANDAANAGVNWSSTCGSPGFCGSFNPTSTASGAATTYRAPSAVPTGNTVTLTATSVTDATKSASVTIVITNPPTAPTPGTYVFSVSGGDNYGLYSVSGAFTVASGGVISGGEQDFIDLNPINPPGLARPLHDTILSTGSSYVTSSSDGNILITLNTGDTKIGVSGVETLDATLVSTSSALIVEFDASAFSRGTLELQTSTPAPSGGYAFSLSGENPSSDAPIAIGGVLNVDSAGGISGAGSVFDINGYTAAFTDQLFSPSTVSTTPDSFGRVEFSLIPAAADSSATPAINLIGYEIDAGHIKLVETADSFGGVTGGTALAQTGTGGFSGSSISGSSLVFGAAGDDTLGALQVAGVLTANSDLSVGGTLSFNDVTKQNQQGGSAITGGTYTVDSTGRVTVTGLTDSASDFTYNLQLYLTGDGHALVISVDTDDVLAGVGFAQSGSFSAATFSGGYALSVKQDVLGSGFENEGDGVGLLTADGVGTLAGFSDLNERTHTGGTSQIVELNDLVLSGGFLANSNGVYTGELTGLDHSSATKPDNFTFYMVDATKVVAIETDANQLTLGFLEIQQ